MSRVTLGEVCREYKGRAEAAEGLPVVGLEHLSQSDIDLVGCSHEATTFTKAFRKGHVLFGRRRAYLKKASLAPFDGVCSGDIIVIEAIEGRLLPRLLPFVIQNDYLFDFAVENSAGSLSPRVKWKDLSRFEFELPSMEKQHELADLLWAAQEAKRAYSRLVSACDEIVKSRFVEMFPPGRYAEKKLGDCLEQVVAGVNVNGQQRPIQPGEYAVLKISAVTKGYFKSDEYKVIDNPDAVTRMVFPRKGDLLFSRANTREMVGATAIVDADYDNLFLPDKLWRLDFKPEVLTTYAKSFLQLETTRRVLSSLATGTSGSMYNISMKKLRGVVMPLPPIGLQEEFAAFVRQVDKSEFALKQAIEGVSATMAAILNQELGMSDV